MQGRVYELMRAAAVLFVAMGLGACVGRVEYTPGDLDQQAALNAYAQRAPDSSALADLVRASGYEGQWPPEQWRLDTLTLLALYFNPEVDLARAEALAAQAALTTASKRAPLSVDLAVEHHSREVDGDKPWSLGLAVGLPVGGRGRREAQVAKASLLADAAELEIAAAAWRVRGAVRDALIDLSASAAGIELLEQRIAVQQELLRLVQRRVDAGMFSARDAGREQLALSLVEVELALAKSAQTNVLGELSQALGLPLETVRSLRIDDHALEDPSDVPEAATARARALRNRIDIHQRLLEYGVADAELRLAVAAQDPAITLAPGYMWDQGDNVWSLMTSLIVPPAVRAAVHEADVRRDVAARRFMAIQIQVIGEVEQARENVAAAGARISAADEVLQRAHTQQERARRLFDSGGSDRLELVASRLSLIQAQQHQLEARVAWYQSGARYEDVVQMPFSPAFPAPAGEQAQTKVP